MDQGGRRASPNSKTGNRVAFFEKASEYYANRLSTDDVINAIAAVEGRTFSFLVSKETRRWWQHPLGP